MNCCDRFNTAPSPALNADCVTSPDSSKFECYATRDVAEGEQLFVPYARGAETGAEFVGQQGSLLRFCWLKAVGASARPGARRLRDRQRARRQRALGPWINGGVGGGQ